MTLRIITDGQAAVSTPRMVAGFLRGVRHDGKPVRAVMVAGDREGVLPGIGERAERFLTATFRMLAKG
jgi:hypothetical protein